MTNLPRNQIICCDWIEGGRGLPDKSIHCIITSPPYWGQRIYGWGGDGSCENQKQPHQWQDISSAIMQCELCGMKAPKLGIEKTPEEHIENLVIGFRELRRVLRDDGTLWLNYGDKYAGSGMGPSKSLNKEHHHLEGMLENNTPVGLKSGDLVCLPWRIALALQADGWYLRSAIIWCKAWSFHDCGERIKKAVRKSLFGEDVMEVIRQQIKTYHGSTMPESVNGWRWERHRVKVGGKGTRGNVPSGWDTQHKSDPKQGRYDNKEADLKWQDCPGCPKCEKNDGLVLRKGSWRPTSAYEYLFLFTKTDTYFADAEAVREGWADERQGNAGKYDYKYHREARGCANTDTGIGSGIVQASGRNLRNVWCIGTRGYKDAHYATFPEALIEPCIKASTSEKGCCPKCGAPWVRIVDTRQIKRERPQDLTDRHRAGKGINACPNTVAGVSTNTLGWRPTCKCGIDKTVPAAILDPFMGSGTVPVVARKLGRDFVGFDLNPDYIENQARPRLGLLAS